jgi:poly-gamma-glutamate synthesis protein (capsule biosynthesis protein)
VSRSIRTALSGLLIGALIAACSAAPSGGPPTGSPNDGLAAEPTSTSAATAAPTSSPIPTPQPTPTPIPQADVAVVPVTHFRSARTTTTAAEVALILAGGSHHYDAVELVEADADAILAAIGASPPANPTRLVLAPDAATLGADLAASRKRLAFVRADQVGPNVRAIAWSDHELFGVDRVADLAAWPLAIGLPVTEVAEPEYDPAAAWTLVAGGDIMLDRGVYDSLVNQGRGPDFMFDGGTAEITGRTCCSSFGWVIPQARRTGDAGAVRSLLQGADLAIANFENPAPDAFKWHTTGTVFSASPALIEGIANAGIDWVSLANNHIRDAGAAGILQTIENLDEFGVAHGGAGANVTAAHAPSIRTAGKTTVAILGYDAIAAYYAAGPDRVGSAQLSAAACQADAAAARAAGADLVIAFPHWGAEYRATPSSSQRKVAHACLDAGVDLIIGNHAHWAAALEVHEGKPIWYALGNLVFDQTWSEPTMEGVTLELTFDGARLVQARMRPHIILDKAQPNFLDPAGDGKVVMDQLFAGSKGLLDW